jgi:hypothetical protein
MIEQGRVQADKVTASMLPSTLRSLRWTVLEILELGVRLMESSGSGKVTSYATRGSTPSRSRFWVWELLGALEYHTATQKTQRPSPKRQSRNHNHDRCRGKPLVQGI